MAIDRPWGVVPDIAIPAVPDDERLWVPEPGKENVWFRPLMLDTVRGGWTQRADARAISRRARRACRGRSLRRCRR